MENEERAPARAGGKGKRKVPKLAGFGTISEINTLPGSVTFGVERAEREGGLSHAAFCSHSCPCGRRYCPRL